MRRTGAWVLAVVTAAALLVGSPTAHAVAAAEVYTMTTNTADTCTAWTSSPTTGQINIASATGTVAAGTLTLSQLFGSGRSVPVSGGPSPVSLSLATGLARGAYDVKYTDGNGNTSPTYRLNICLPAFTGMADRVSGTAANLLLTVTTPFNSGYPFCVATPATVNGTNQGWEASTWGTVRNKTASGWELIQPIIGPAPIPDLAQLTGYVICATSTAAGAAVTIVGTYTAQLPSIVPFIKAAYQDFLGRQPSSQEVTDWAGRLTAVTVTREGFLRSVANSPEWLGLIVRKMYLDTLGREPDPVGLATWVDWIRTGRVTVVAAAAGFYSSPEFYQGLGGNTLTTWVTKLYEKLLNRAPDPAGLQFWIGYAANPAYGHTWVAEQFYQSLESRLTRVKNLYQALLKRDPDPTGWPFWAQIILTKGDVELAVSLASSAEYDLRAQARFP